MKAEREMRTNKGEDPVPTTNVNSPRRSTRIAAKRVRSPKSVHAQNVCMHDARTAEVTRALFDASPHVPQEALPHSSAKSNTRSPPRQGRAVKKVSLSDEDTVIKTRELISAELSPRPQDAPNEDERRTLPQKHVAEFAQNHGYEDSGILLYQVKLYGYPECDNMWEPIANIPRSKITPYCRHQGISLPADIDEEIVG